MAWVLRGSSRCDFFSASSKSSCVKGLPLVSVCCVCGCEPPDFMDCERRPTLDEGPGLMDSWVCWRDSPTAGRQLLSPVLWSRGIGDPTLTLLTICNIGFVIYIFLNLSHVARCPRDLHAGAGGLETLAALGVGAVLAAGEAGAHGRVLALIALTSPGVGEGEGFQLFLMLFRNGTAVLQLRHLLAGLVDIAVFARA